MDPEREVLVTSGATGALHAAAMALFDPGDEVLVFEPFYGYHVSTLRSMRVVPVVVPLMKKRSNLSESKATLVTGPGMADTSPSKAPKLPEAALKTARYVCVLLKVMSPPTYSVLRPVHRITLMMPGCSGAASIHCCSPLW